jgi:hypothetical protein
MKKTVTAFGAVIGLAMLGACAPSTYDDYGYRSSYYGGSAYYGPDYYPGYYPDPYYYGGGYRGGVTIVPDHHREGYRRDGNRQRDGRRDNARNDDRNPGSRDYRGRAGQNTAPRPPQQSQQQWQPQPGVSPRAQIFGGGNAAPRPAAPPPAAGTPAPNPPSGWYGFQGRNPNDPNDTN